MIRRASVFVAWACTHARGEDQQTFDTGMRMRGSTAEGATFERGGLELVRDEAVVGEVCQDYLFHPDAADRIGLQDFDRHSPRFEPG